MANVVVEVEVLVVHPDGVVLERSVGEPLAVARDAPQPGGDVARTRARSTPPSGVASGPTSKIAVAPRCMGVAGVSKARNRLSSRDSRSYVEAATGTSEKPSSKSKKKVKSAVLRCRVCPGERVEVTSISEPSARARETRGARETGLPCAWGDAALLTARRHTSWRPG